MNLQYFYHFIAIVENGSFSAASRKLGIAQPALSNQVKALEQRYETRLLQRGSGTHGLELTETGRILFDAAKQMIEAEEKAASEIAEFHGTGDTLRLGLTNPPGNQYLFDAITTYTERFPDTKVMVREAGENELFRMLFSGILEGILMLMPGEAPDEAEILLQYHDDIVACYAPGAFFAGNAEETVSAGELCKFPLCASQDNLKRFRASFRNIGYTFLPKYVGTDTNACLMWAQNGKAVALVPRSAVRTGNGLVAKSIENGVLGQTEVAFVARKKQYRSLQMNRFLDICLEQQSGVQSLKGETRQ